MNIIIEGPDCSGKSTLADRLSVCTHRRVLRSSGPPLTTREMLARISKAMDQSGVIFDRHPAISEYVYGGLRGTSLVDIATVDKLARENLLIYAQSKSLSDHVVKDHDTPDHLDLVNTRHEEIRQRYDDLLRRRAHIHYVWWENPDITKEVAEWIC